MYSMSRNPCRDEHTTCAVLAPEAVFTGRTYGDTPNDTTRISAQTRSGSCENLQVSDPKWLADLVREPSQGTAKVAVLPGEPAIARQRLHVRNPVLWGPHAPNLLGNEFCLLHTRLQPL
jgi:hypothetical protein